MFDYEQMKELNELEMTMYNYIITHADKVTSMTIRQLAKELNVSSTTVLRFCSKLGCEGYSEFKYQFKEYLKDKNHENLADDFSAIEDFFMKVKHGDLHMQIQKIAQVIYEHERIFFMGLGTSGTLDKYGARYLSNFGKYAMYLEDPFYPMGKNPYINTAVVVMSVSGEQQFLFKQVQELKKRNVTIISITNSKQCTIAEISDYNIAYYIPMLILPGRYNVTSSIPVVYILERLAHEVNHLMEQHEKSK